jgi:hypothetical protein
MLGSSGPKKSPHHVQCPSHSAVRTHRPRLRKCRKANRLLCSPHGLASIYAVREWCCERRVPYYAGYQPCATRGKLSLPRLVHFSLAPTFNLTFGDAPLPENSKIRPSTCPAEERRPCWRPPGCPPCLSFVSGGRTNPKKIRALAS